MKTTLIVLIIIFSAVLMAEDGYAKNQHTTSFDVQASNGKWLTVTFTKMQQFEGIARSEPGDIENQFRIAIEYEDFPAADLGEVELIIDVEDDDTNPENHAVDFNIILRDEYNQRGFILVKNYHDHSPDHGELIEGFFPMYKRIIPMALYKKQDDGTLKPIKESDEEYSTAFDLADESSEKYIKVAKSTVDLKRPNFNTAAIESLIDLAEDLLRKLREHKVGQSKEQLAKNAQTLENAISERIVKRIARNMTHGIGRFVHDKDLKSLDYVAEEDDIFADD